MMKSKSSHSPQPTDSSASFDPVPPDSPASTKGIDISNLSVTIEGKTLLSRVNLKLHSGEIMAIIGPAGSGKSLLLKAIAGLQRVDVGAELRIGEEACNTNDESGSWQRHFGMSFQNDALFDDMTVLGNIAFPLRQRGVGEPQSIALAKQVLKAVGLETAEEEFPRALSGGMKKRVGIARAVVAEPKIGLFDEPTAGLDPQSAQMILNLLREQTGRLAMSTIIVSNDLGVVLPICHSVLMLNGGCAIYQGGVEELVESSDPAVRQFISGSDEGPL